MECAISDTAHVTAQFSKRKATPGGSAMVPPRYHPWYRPGAVTGAVPSGTAQIAEICPNFTPFHISNPNITKTPNPLFTLQQFRTIFSIGITPCKKVHLISSIKAIGDKA